MDFMAEKRAIRSKVEARKCLENIRVLYQIFEDPDRALFVPKMFWILGIPVFYCSLTVIRQK